MKANTPNPVERTNGAIWVFTPSRTNPSDLEFILVQRHKLLEDAVERVRESALTDHKHHLLFVGPRGCGKTHLVTLIVSRLSADDALTDHLRIAWLNEDETCMTLLEFLVKIHSALEKRYPDAYREEMLAAAYDMKQAAAMEFVSRQLISSLGSRTLLVVVENLDAIFEGLGDAGQKQLRAFIQENPKLSIVATAQRLVEDLSKRTSPFFGFFQTEHLKPLNVEEATELLQNIARLQGKESVVEFLSTTRGYSRVRALHHLSGGNHRIYIVLSQFITRDSVDALLGPFMKMVDELTPYYQERIRWLPPLQRKIIEYLCSCEGTVPVKEIAKKLFATPQTISSQLQDLREKGYVESNHRGRESLYEISEPLMRICVEVKEHQLHQPLRLLVDFLRVWYDDYQLKDRLGKMEPASSTCVYLESAIQKNSVEGNLRKRLIFEEFQVALPEKLDNKLRESLMRELGDQPEGVLLAMDRLRAGDKAQAMQCIDDALAHECSSSEKAALLFFRARLHSSDNHVKKIEDYTAVIELTDAPVEQVAKALFNRGITYGQSGDAKREIEDYTAVIELAGAPVEQVAKAIYSRGVRLFKTGQIKDSKSEFEKLIGLLEAPPKNIVETHLVLAELDFSEGKWDDGFQSIKASLKCGGEILPAYQESPSNLVDVIFAAGLSPQGRSERVTSLLHIYRKYAALPILGGALVQHVGSLFHAGEPFPSADNLEGWASAWEHAVKGMDDFRLSIRLLRTGIDFIKSGGKDPGILLSLASPERAILKQAFGLVENGNS